MIGAPPVGGFVSKWYLLVGALDAGSVLIIAVLISSTLLNTANLAPGGYQDYFGRASASDSHHRFTEAPLAMVIPLSITAAISVFIGIYPEFFMTFAKALLL
jgi:multicomponent Na+:H+ antiporter subunit D